MGALTIADLVPGDAEPRIKDLMLAERLGMGDTHDIRRLIERNAVELRGHGALISGTGPKIRGRGRPGKHFLLNEAQALTICALARTPAAAKMRAELIRVFMAYRRGEMVPADEVSGQFGAKLFPPGLSENQIAEAQARIAILGRVEELQSLGIRVSRAVRAAASEAGISEATVWDWRARLLKQQQVEPVVALAPRWGGGGKRAEIDREVWLIFQRNQMAAEQPVAARSYRQAQAAAQALGVAIPHCKTFQRRFQAEALRALRAEIARTERGGE